MKIGDLVVLSPHPDVMGVIVEIDGYDVYIYDFVANEVWCNVDYDVVVISEA